MKTSQQSANTLVISEDSPQTPCDAMIYADIFLIVLDNIQDLTHYIVELNDLASNSAVRNPFYEPWMLIPVARACADRQRLVFVLVFESTPQTRPRLLGFFPFERTSRRFPLPLSSLRIWKDPFHYLPRSDPLLRKGCEACVDAVLDWFQKGKAKADILDLRGLRNDTIILYAIQRGLMGKPALRFDHTTMESHLYKRHVSARAYIDEVFSKKSQKSLRYSERRLQDLGPLEYTDSRSCVNIDVLIDEFLHLESCGWKGRHGVAVSSNRHSEMIKEILKEAHRRNHFSLLTLRVGGELIAARCVFLSPPGSFLFKIAYDERETYAKRSPGLLLELEAIRRLHSDTDALGAGIKWLDTCGSSNSPIFRRTRSEPLAIHRYRIVRRRTVASIVLAMQHQLMPQFLKLQERWRQFDHRS